MGRKPQRSRRRAKLMSASPSPDRETPEVSPLDERLDPQTENLIEEFRWRGIQFHTCPCGELECRHSTRFVATRAALRARIRELVEEARRDEGRIASESISAYFESEA